MGFDLGGMGVDLGGMGLDQTQGYRHALDAHCH
jgi:hypothetical protein